MKINLILLAAGYSKRFGDRKLLVPIDGKPLYEITIEKLLQLEKENEHRKLLVVTSYAEIVDYCKKHAIAYVTNCGVQNTGIASSIKVALIHLMKMADAGENQPSCDVFFPADQPFLDVSEVADFLEQFVSQQRKIGTMSCHGEWRAPNIFSKIYRKELLNLPPDKGGKYVMLQHKEDVFVYASENERQFFDIDTRKDYESIIDKHSS